MRSAVKWGLLLGFAVGLQNLLFGVAGWHTIYSMVLVYLAIAIVLNVVAVVWCLRETAAEASWWGQLRNGLVIGLASSVLIFASAWLVAAVIFPDYFVEMAEGYRAAYAETDVPQEEVEEILRGVAETSPVRSAFEGVAGTMVVSVVTAAIAGIWVRRRDPDSKEVT